MGENLKYNNSGCADPTAYEAIIPIIKEDATVERKAKDLLKLIKRTVALTGFELIGRVQFRHKKSGREFK